MGKTIEVEARVNLPTVPYGGRVMVDPGDERVSDLIERGWFVSVAPAGKGRKKRGGDEGHAADADGGSSSPAVTPDAA